MSTCVLRLSITSDMLQPHGLYIACQAPLSVEFSQQEYQSGLSFPSPGDLLDPRIELTSPTSPALTGGFFTTEATRETPIRCILTVKNKFWDVMYSIVTIVNKTILYIC